MKPTQRTVLHRPHASRRGVSLLCAPLLVLVACGLPDRELGELAGTDTDAGTSGVSGVSASGNMSGTDAADETTGGPDGFPTECVSAEEWPIDCREDVDGDDIRLACDNAPDYFNPDQNDVDNDTVGDVADLCVTVASDPNADSDGDGIGNECDSCPFTPIYYNGLVDGPPFAPDGLRVRNIPDIGDADGDGIGDACDNCVTVANCAGFDASAPWQAGDAIDREDTTTCQQDADLDGVGDACDGAMAEGAAGPVGFQPDDDFDQDGLRNEIDGCARLPVSRIVCTGDGDCPSGASCEPGAEQSVCSHPDSDGDGIGDACDTCTIDSNPEQIIDGGAQEDDDDGDFVGEACELGADCNLRPSPRATAFYPVSVAGQCCAVLLDAQDDGSLLRPNGVPLLHADGRIVTLGCDPEGTDTCVRLPDAVAQAPGMVVPPAGCDEALGGAPASSQRPLRIGDDVASLEELWSYRCELPPFDQDFDGLGDACDFCTFAFDPDNTPYIDASGQVWPNDGKYCNGDYSIENVCGGQ